MSIDSRIQWLRNSGVLEITISALFGQRTMSVHTGNVTTISDELVSEEKGDCEQQNDEVSFFTTASQLLSDNKILEY